MSALIAEHFLKKVVKDDIFRKFLYTFSSHEERMKYLGEKGFNFSESDINEAVNHLVADSPTEENAILVKELYMWWLMFQDKPATEYTSCSPSACASCSSCK